MPIPDSPGNTWYCYVGKGKSGRKRRSYRYDQAMWDHLMACHGHWFVDNIKKFG